MFFSYTIFDQDYDNGVVILIKIDEIRFAQEDVMSRKKREKKEKKKLTRSQRLALATALGLAVAACYLIEYFSPGSVSSVFYQIFEVLKSTR